MTFDEDESALELEFDNPGTYSVTVKTVPHLDATFEVTVP
jgi:hypothetical protein